MDCHCEVVTDMTCPVCGASLEWSALAPICIHHVALHGIRPEACKDTLIPRRWAYCLKCQQAFLFVKDQDAWHNIDLHFQNLVDMFVVDNHSEGEQHETQRIV